MQYSIALPDGIVWCLMTNGICIYWIRRRAMMYVEIERMPCTRYSTRERLKKAKISVEKTFFIFNLVVRDLFYFHYQRTIVRRQITLTRRQWGAWVSRARRIWSIGRERERLKSDDWLMEFAHLPRAARVAISSQFFTSTPIRAENIKSSNAICCCLCCIKQYSTFSMLVAIIELQDRVARCHWSSNGRQWEAFFEVASTRLLVLLGSLNYCAVMR